MGHVCAIYEPLLDFGWVDTAPTVDLDMPALGAPVPAEWTRTAFHKTLRCGDVEVQWRGFTVIDFEHWPPGCVDRSEGRFPTLGRVYEAAKPALIQRLRAANGYALLLHSASNHVGRG
jgi:hypothetical protein